VPAAPPVPGADTDAVLGGLGLGQDEVAELRAAGIVG
jgi:crotonobetainyl-CoA:carnitine CoA-transferase CaiB-like acyl-CoA transferase